MWLKKHKIGRHFGRSDGELVLRPERKSLVNLEKIKWVNIAKILLFEKQFLS